jgi:hypothetical protein
VKSVLHGRLLKRRPFPAGALDIWDRDRGSRGEAVDAGSTVGIELHHFDKVRAFAGRGHELQLTIGVHQHEAAGVGVENLGALFDKGMKEIDDIEVGCERIRNGHERGVDARLAGSFIHDRSPCSAFAN